MRPFLIPFVLLVVAGCGGSGGGGGGGGPTANPGPDVALLFCSGHGLVATPYLAGDIGPVVEDALSGAGYDTATWHFVDDVGGGNELGYTDLVGVLVSIRDSWIVGRLDPTQVVVIAHSHGGVRAHAAIRAVSDCPVRLVVDLDNSSFGWSLSHPFENTGVMGGHPANAYSIATNGVCALYPAVPNEPGPAYDLEDVIHPNVAEALEVRSGDEVVPLEQFDEHWNIRIDGTATGLFCFYSGTDHGEVHSDTGTTVPIVVDWILDRLDGP